jgi:hypothetical protein
LIALAVQRHEEGKLSKDDLTEIKLSAWSNIYHLKTLLTV